MQPLTDSSGAAFSPVDEGLFADQSVLPRPAGFGTEASTSSTSFQLIDEYSVPADSVGRLSELSISIQSNGEAKVSVSGTTFGPFTGALDVTIPLTNSTLTEGYDIRAFHRSTDGNSTTTRATTVVLEV